MNATFTNVRGAEDLLARVVDCWASLFGARVVAYRASRGFTAEPAIAVVVQKMVASERSGVVFTTDPSTGDTSRVVVEGALGLGEVVVSGSVEPDTYVLAKDGLTVLRARVGGLWAPAPRPPTWPTDNWWLVQARPITTLGSAQTVTVDGSLGEVLPGDQTRKLTTT